MTKSKVLLFCLGVSLSANPCGASPVDPKDEQWHHMGRSSKHGYEWLYFDLINDDGNQASIMFAGPNPFDPSLQRHLLLDPENHVGVKTELAFTDGRLVSVQEYLHGKRHLAFSADPYQ